ncbi:hypothetical protein DEO72_LG11g1791 [Vigna unguiculata]|uniref:Uncharacterized protein n=1 Tax=Vigna unguiculata TaxID=3917 RepID=A0A4D6NR86_VIGUN|nr:hypothetical protein DEO72_LG11g1791 [Vigna unguiculata]
MGGRVSGHGGAAGSKPVKKKGCDASKSWSLSSHGHHHYSSLPPHAPISAPPHHRAIPQPACRRHQSTPETSPPFSAAQPLCSHARTERQEVVSPLQRYRQQRRHLEPRRRGICRLHSSSSQARPERSLLRHPKPPPTMLRSPLIAPLPLKLRLTGGDGFIPFPLKKMKMKGEGDDEYEIGSAYDGEIATDSQLKYWWIVNDDPKSGKSMQADEREWKGQRECSGSAAGAAVSARNSSCSKVHGKATRVASSEAGYDPRMRWRAANPAVETTRAWKGQHGRAANSDNTSLDNDETFNSFIRRAKGKLRTVSHIGREQSNVTPVPLRDDDEANARDNLNDQFSNFIKSSKKKLRSTSSMRKHGSFNRR